MKNRRSLTPPMGVPSSKGGTQAMRRGGVRREVSERVAMTGLNQAGQKRGGWALNVSRGGVRVILEEKVELGEEYEVTVGEPDHSPLTRRARVVWVQEEKDGVIVGLEFMTVSGAHRSIPPPAPTQ